MGSAPKKKSPVIEQFRREAIRLGIEKSFPSSNGPATAWGILPGEISEKTSGIEPHFQTEYVRRVCAEPFQPCFFVHTNFVSINHQLDGMSRGSLVSLIGEPCAMRAIANGIRQTELKVCQPENVLLIKCGGVIDRSVFAKKLKLSAYPKRFIIVDDVNPKEISDNMDFLREVASEAGWMLVLVPERISWKDYGCASNCVRYMSDYVFEFTEHREAHHTCSAAGIVLNSAKHHIQCTKNRKHGNRHPKGFNVRIDNGVAYEFFPT